MNYTQNEKIEQVTESTLVLGVDIGSSEHLGTTGSLSPTFVPARRV